MSPSVKWLWPSFACFSSRSAPYSGRPRAEGMLRRLGGSLGRVPAPRPGDPGTGLAGGPGPGSGQAGRGRKGGPGTRNSWPGGDFASPFPPGGKSQSSWGAQPAGLHAVTTSREPWAVFSGGGGSAGGWDAAKLQRWAVGVCLRGVCRGWRSCSQPLRTSNCTSPRSPSRALPFFLSRSFLPLVRPCCPLPLGQALPSGLPPRFSPPPLLPSAPRAA